MDLDNLEREILDAETLLSKDVYKYNRKTMNRGDDKLRSVTEKSKSLSKQERSVIIQQLLDERRRRTERKETSHSNTEKKKKKKKKVVLSRNDKECTFKPKINTSYKSKRQRSKGKKRLEELSRSRLITLEKREKQKYQKMLKESKECTFRPKTNATNSKTMSLTSNTHDDDNVSERLYKLAQKRIYDRQRVAKEREEKRVQKHKFVPKINPDSVSILNMDNHIPLQNRIGSMQRAKSERLQRLRMETTYGSRFFQEHVWKTYTHIHTQTQV